MGVPPMRWTGLLLAILAFLPTSASSQSFGRVVRASAVTGAAVSGGAVFHESVVVTRRARGVAAVRGGTSTNVNVVVGRETAGSARSHRFGTVVNPVRDVATQEAAPTSISAVPEKPQPIEKRHETATLAWKPGGLRVTGWTESSESSPGDRFGTVIRPDCSAEGLTDACVPADLYDVPPSSDAVAADLIVVPFRTQIYPLSYSYYYGLPFPPLALSLESIESAAPPCVQQQNGQTPTRRLQQRKRSSRLFGWLYRSIRNVDMEKSSAPALFYLRSPLLAGFADDLDCPEDERLTTAAEVCSTITVRSEKEAPRVAQVALPVLDSEDSSELRETLETRLGAGEAIVLSTLDGKALLLSPNHVRELDVRPCVMGEDDVEDDGMPTFAY